MEFNPLLTIAIPTFNRVDCLRLLVTSLMKQIEVQHQKILGIKLEILVCNNASTDGTSTYLKELAGVPGITIFQHEINCGSDLNIASCCQLALGKYVWIMGDDDFPMVDTLLMLIDFLNSKNPDLVYLPARWEMGDLTQFIHNKVLSNEIVQVSNMELAVRSNVYVTFISSWIMNMEKYRKITSPDYRRFAGTSLAQLEWIFSLFSYGERFFVARENMIFARAGNSGGYTVFEVFSKNFNRIVEDAFASKPKMLNFFRRSMLWCFIPGIIWGVRKNTIGKFEKFDYEEIMNVLKSEYGSERFFKWLVVPILRSNIKVAHCFWLTTRVFSKTRLFLIRKFYN